MNLSRLWIAGEADEATLRAARTAGIELVVDLRAPSEIPWDEAAKAAELGLRYRNIPVPGAIPLLVERGEDA